MRDQTIPLQRNGNGAVAVIIVNYQTAMLAAQAVRSVLEHAPSDRDFHIHLVDNASPTDDAAVLQRLHTQESWQEHVTLYLQKENLGFGRANNVVLRTLAAQSDGAEFALLLNPDAMLMNDAAGYLARHLENHPSAGAAGACVHAPGGGPVTAAFRFPSPTVDFVSAAAFGPLTRFLPDKTLWLEPTPETRRVDWLAGAAVMVRMNTLKETDLFDPDFFLYFEEVELMWRMAQAGWERWYVPDARVAHAEGAATDVRSGDPVRKRRPEYWYRSQMLYDAKTATRWGAVWQALARYAGSGMQAVISALRGRPQSLPKRYFTDYGRHVIRPLLRREPALGPQDAPGVCQPSSMSRAQQDIDSHVNLNDDVNSGTSNNNPADISFRALIAEDFRTQGSLFFNQGFWALFWHRFGNWRMSVKPRLLRIPLSVLYKTGSKLVEWSTGIFMPYTVVLGRRVRLEYFGSMILVARAIGDDVTIRQNTTFGIATDTDLNSRPTIGDRVNIGAGAVIIGNIKIGAGTVIGANSVVNRDQPANVIIAGAPARIIRKPNDPRPVSIRSGT